MSAERKSYGNFISKEVSEAAVALAEEEHEEGNNSQQDRERDR